MVRSSLLWVALLCCPFQICRAGLSACDDLSAVAETPAVDFTSEIQPIFDAHCTTCHGPPNPIAFMDLTLGQQDLVDVESFQLTGFDRVKPGMVSQSLLYLKINCGNQFIGDRMPFNAPPLNLSQQALIRDWIKQILIFSDGFD